MAATKIGLWRPTFSMHFCIIFQTCYPLFMQLSIAIHSGALAPSAVLARINSYSTRNRFALALQELGKAVRTTLLLDGIMDDTMRRAVHTPVERELSFQRIAAIPAA